MSHPALFLATLILKHKIFPVMVEEPLRSLSQATTPLCSPYPEIAATLSHPSLSPSVHPDLSIPGAAT